MVAVEKTGLSLWVMSEEPMALMVLVVADKSFGSMSQMATYTLTHQTSQPQAQGDTTAAHSARL